MAKKAVSKKPAKRAAAPAKPKAKAAKPGKSAKAKPAAPVKKPAPAVRAKPALPSKPAAKAKPAPAKPAPKAAAVKAPPAKAAPAKAAPAKPAPAAKPEPKPASSKAAAKASAPLVPGLKIPTPPPPRVAVGAAVAVAVAVSKPKAGAGRSQPRKPLAPIVVAGDERVRPDLPANYRPAPGEQYMSPLQLEYFRQKLLKWRVELVEESKQTIDNLRDEVRDVGDEAERATRETENSLELRTRDRYRKLISKIDKALRRIEDGEYGYCEETGEEIGIERLEARPIATLCLDAQERWEHRQRQMGD
jgi:DnaK suppressor protein